LGAEENCDMVAKLREHIAKIPPLGGNRTVGGKSALSESMAGILSALTAEWQFNPLLITKTTRYLCRRDRVQSPGIRGKFARCAAGAAGPPFCLSGKDIFR
jgi:hypothetical protein